MCLSADKQRCGDYDTRRNTRNDVPCSNISEKKIIAFRVRSLKITFHGNWRTWNYNTSFYEM